MGWMVPLWYSARRRREEGDGPCGDSWWPLPLIVVSLLILGIAVMVLVSVRVPAVAMTLVIAGLVVVLALVVLLAGLLR